MGQHALLQEDLRKKNQPTPNKREQLEQEKEEQSAREKTTLTEWNEARQNKTPVATEAKQQRQSERSSRK